jgi:hypothetical protein
MFGTMNSVPVSKSLDVATWYKVSNSIEHDGPIFARKTQDGRTLLREKRLSGPTEELLV